jgi:predicted outer membrane repeat protein
VLTILGHKNAVSFNLQGLSIAGGAANGKDMNGFGGGIYNQICYPTFNECVITKNIAISGGAGIYNGAGLKLIEHCLFKQNILTSGQGAGMLNANGPLTIQGVVFENNYAPDTSIRSGGGALCLNNSNAEIINSIFYFNRTGKSGGAIYNIESSPSVINCTFVKNSAVTDGGAIYSDTVSYPKIFNAILWENTSSGAYNQISGPVAVASHSCIQGGFAGGINIIDADPVFLDINNPAGQNGKYGDVSEDGLNLAIGSSPCINAGLDSINIPESDIVLTPRIQPDIGAYEAFKFTDESEKTFGYIDPSGQFVPDEPVKALDTIKHWWYINIYAASNLGYVARVYVPKNKYTVKKSNIYSLLYSLNADGSDRTDLSPVSITLYKVGETGDKLIFQSRTPAKVGKPIVFVMDKSYHNWNNYWAYVVSTTSGMFKAITPASQF